MCEEERLLFEAALLPAKARVADTIGQTLERLSELVRSSHLGGRRESPGLRRSPLGARRLDCHMRRLLAVSGRK